jgi:hypothetical protein
MEVVLNSYLAGPLYWQLVLIAIAFLMILKKNKESYHKIVRGDHAFCFGGCFRMVINVNDFASPVIVRSGYKQFTCIPSSINMIIQDVTEWKSIEKRSTGYLAGTSTGDGTIIPGRVITIFTPTGEGGYVTVGKEAVFSFIFILDKSNTDKPCEIKTINFPIGSSEVEVFEKLWAQVEKLLKEKHKAIQAAIEHDINLAC